MPDLQTVTHSYTYAGNTVSVPVWLSPITTFVHTVVLLGTVQVGKLAEWVAAACPPGTIVVEGAPHWLAKADGSDIPVFMAEYSRQSLQFVMQAYKPKKLHIIAESQAVPGTLMTLRGANYRKHVNAITLLQPLGFNTAAFGQTDIQRIQIFKRRISQNMRHQIRALLSDSRLRYNHRQLLRIVDMKSSEALAQYASGLRYDAIPDLQYVCNTHLPIRILCGSHDTIFRAAEIQKSITQNNIGITVISVPGIPHSPLSTRLGMSLLHAALAKDR